MDNCYVKIPFEDYCCLLTELDCSISQIRLELNKDHLASMIDYYQRGLDRLTELRKRLDDRRIVEFL